MEKTKLKQFFKDNKKVIVPIALCIGSCLCATAAYLIMKDTQKKAINNLMPSTDNSYKAILESYGATFDGFSDVPLATKEVVDKFLIERGSTYQIDILDDRLSVIWIIK